MKAFQNFIFLAISSFVVVGISVLLTGKSFFNRFTLDVFGFLAIMQFIFPALAYVYVYEKTLINKKIDIDKPQGIDKVIVFVYLLVFAVSNVFSLLMIYLATGKVEFETSFVTATAMNNFIWISAGLGIHKQYGSIPIIRLNEKPIFYLKLFFFSIIGICAYILVIYALATLQFHKKLEVTATQFIFDCVLYAILTVSFAFIISFGLNKIPFFRKSIVLPILVTTIVTFLLIKLLGYPQNYFRVLITENVLEYITLFPCLIIVCFPIARSKRNFKIKKLTSDFSKKEAEYLQLKNQINPHFLFNNLNVLVSFIELDPKKAVDFGIHLSNVYRHYLKNQTEDFVSLQAELNFITEYLAIYKAKFENGFTFTLPTEVSENQYILSSCLQELIDNVFKHNNLDDENPLDLKIFIELNSLVIQNTINKKEVESSSNFGLDNIKKRYELLTNNDIQITETKVLFKVTIPILELES